MNIKTKKQGIRNVDFLVKVQKQGLTKNSSWVRHISLCNTNFTVFQDCESGNILRVQLGGLWFEPEPPIVSTLEPSELNLLQLIIWASDQCTTKVLFEDPRESGNPDVSRELAAALQILHINKYGERFTDGLYIVLAEFTSFTKEEIIAQYDEVLSKI